MNNHPNANHEKTRKLTGLAILSAIIVVLQVICTFIKFGPFSITLALAPIIVGGALYGRRCAALLGGVLGLVILVTGLFGWDGGVVLLLLGVNPVATVALCLLKTIAAGYFATLVYDAIAKKNTLGAVFAAGVVCPVVNTGLFILGMLAFFTDTLYAWAGGKPILSYILLGLVGLNFLVELGVNLLLATGITQIIKVVSARRR